MNQTSRLTLTQSVLVKRKKKRKRKKRSMAVMQMNKTSHRRVGGGHGPDVTAFFSINRISIFKVGPLFFSLPPLFRHRSIATISLFFFFFLVFDRRVTILTRLPPLLFELCVCCDYVCRDPADSLNASRSCAIHFFGHRPKNK